jgi:hypothetical protein
MIDDRQSPFGDPEMHRLFRALREHIVEVAETFTRRVLFRVQAVIDERKMQAPTLDQIVGETTAETTNLVVGSIKATLRDPEEGAARQPGDTERTEERDDE